MTGRFTFTLTEKELSLLFDALEAATVSPPTFLHWCRDDYAELGELLAQRLQW